MLDENDAGVGIGRLGLVADVRAVVVAERGCALADPLGERLRVLARRVERDPQRQALGVHEVVGARGADGDELRRRREETNSSARGEVSTTSTFARSLETAPRSAGRTAGISTASPAGPSKRCSPAVLALTKSTARLMTSIVRRYASSAAVAPDDEAVLGQHDELELRVLAHRGADLLGEREAGPDVRDPGRLVAEALGDEPLAVARAGQHVDAVRVRVVHVRSRDERVQQRLDRRARRRRVDLAARQVGDHVLVAHLLALEHREHLVEPQRREVLALHRRQVAARALDPHDVDLAADVIGGGALGRRVAAAEVGDRAVGAEQVRGEQDLAERVAGHLTAGRPAVVGRRDHLRERRHRPQPPATETVDPRSATIRST